ncbi:VanZ family protein [Actinocatenispora thailandica]|uniref:VanZ family protein n=1 Tax=Actinocatenispora thailandica TaxID=227318 RepID=UPI00194DDD8E|nr:VanZ family protein [Actinocatenispora thailandica]
MAQESEQPREGGRVLLVALFVVYLALLCWLVLWKLEPPHIGDGSLRHLKLVPFSADGGLDPNSPQEVAANLLMFVPFGLYLRLLAPARPWWQAAVVVAAASVALETTQYVLAIGWSDVTDVITNTAGGAAGIALTALARRRLHARTARVLTRICLIGTVLVLLATGLFVASPLHYAPMHDRSAVPAHPRAGATAGHARPAPPLSASS